MNTSKSPLASHAFNPTVIPKPKSKYNLAKTFLSSANSPGFETALSSREEDKKRARWLLNHGDRAMQQVGQWLKDATEQRELPLSPASSLYMRTCRQKLHGAVHRHIHRAGYADEDIHVFTLIHPKWFFPAGELHQADPKKIKKHLRRCFEHAGILAAEGLLFAGLHGDYDGTGYQLHYHGIAVGDKAGLINSLSGKYGFVTTPTIYRPVQCVPIGDVPQQLSYCLQSWWPKKLRYIDENGIPRRQRKRGRIPHPQHEEILLWMARQHLLSLVLVNGFTGEPWR